MPRTRSRRDAVRSSLVAGLIAGLVCGLILLVGDGSAGAVGHSIPATDRQDGRSTGFVLPMAGPVAVLTPFRPPATRYGVGHRGVDLAGAPGTPIRAAGAGIVVHAAPLAGRGVISIEHQVGLRTAYEPVTASVQPGDAVVAGQVIGVLEAGHSSCAPAVCLHWGARLPDGSYLDPMGLLRGLRVRLLPWDR